MSLYHNTNKFRTPGYSYTSCDHTKIIDAVFVLFCSVFLIIA